jgi:hypothetical protein
MDLANQGVQCLNANFISYASNSNFYHPLHIAEIASYRRWVGFFFNDFAPPLMEKREIALL